MAAYVKLFRASESVTSRLSGLISSAGLTFTQFNVLETLYHLGPMRQRELSGKVMRSDGNITMVLRNLEKADLAKREKTAGSGREYTVSLTENGRAVIGELFPRFAEAVAKEMGVLDLDRLATLGDLCRRVGLKQPAAAER